MYSIMVVNQNEFFPVSIRSVAQGTTGLMVALGNGLAYLLFTDTSEWGFNPFLLIGLLFMSIGIIYIWIPETLNMENRDQIDEVEQMKRDL